MTLHKKILWCGLSYLQSNLLTTNDGGPYSQELQEVKILHYTHTLSLSFSVSLSKEVEKKGNEISNRLSCWGG